MNYQNFVIAYLALWLLPFASVLFMIWKLKRMEAVLKDLDSD